MQMIKWLFGMTRSSARPALLPARKGERRGQAAPKEPSSRGELVRMLMLDTLHFSGVPQDWVDCEVLASTKQDGRRMLHAKLVVSRWHENFVKYAVPFQRQMLGELRRMDPRYFEWFGGIAWQFADDNGCPYFGNPDARSWSPSIPHSLAVDTEGSRNEFKNTEVVLSSSAELAGLDDELQRELNRLIQARDASAGKGRALPQQATAATGFQPTQPYGTRRDFLPTEPLPG